MRNKKQTIRNFNTMYTKLYDFVSKKFSFVYENSIWDKNSYQKIFIPIQNFYLRQGFEYELSVDEKKKLTNFRKVFEFWIRIVNKVRSGT